MRFGPRGPNLGIPSKKRGVVGLYDASTDLWIPIYNKSSLQGFYMACGTTGNQYKNVLIAGKLMAPIIEGCKSGINHEENPIQFTLP